MSLEDAVATVEATSRRGAPPSHAVLCATTGLIRRLDTEDLEGVLSHIAHRDVAVITVASFLGELAGLLTRFGLYAGLGGGFGGGRRRNNQNNNTALVVLAVVAVSYRTLAICRASTPARPWTGTGSRAPSAMTTRVPRSSMESSAGPPAVTNKVADAGGIQHRGAVAARRRSSVLATRPGLGALHRTVAATPRRAPKPCR